MDSLAPYEERARQKRAKQAESIPPAWRLKNIPSTLEVPNAVEYIRQSGLLTPEELKITETTDASVLLQQLATKQLTAAEVVTAFSKRAALAHQLTVCCTEMPFEESIATAKALDEHLEKTGQTVGPLHGLPISIKDQFDIKGLDSAIGMTTLLDLHVEYPC
jgi:amidase